MRAYRTRRDGVPVSSVVSVRFSAGEFPLLRRVAADARKAGRSLSGQIKHLTRVGLVRVGGAAR